ncbi:MAG: hypothetical protein IPQ09_26290 [Myxococcales bacterium]|nr:hypothetical protein [Myxococcales bacterium]
MTLASHAFAPEFTHTSAGAGPDVVLTFSAGTTPVNVTLATGPYRMCLAPAATDYLRALESAINTAITGASHVDSNIAVTLSAAGVVTVTVVDEEDSELVTLTLSAAIAARLGLPTLIDTGGVTWAFVGTRPVWHLALLSAATGPYWQPMQAGGAEQTTGGRVYAIASTLTSWQRSLKVHFQPTTPTLRAAHNCDATAMYPAEEYMSALGSTSTAREWSVLDVLYSARNALCGYTSTWGTARTTTSERIWRVYIGPEALLSTRTELLKAEWLAYCEWDLGLVAPSATPTETRA